MTVVPSPGWVCRLYECRDDNKFFKWKDNCISHIIKKHLLIKVFYCREEGCSETFLRAAHAAFHRTNDHRDASAFEAERLNLAFYVSPYGDFCRDNAPQLAEDLLPLCRTAATQDIREDQSRKLRILLLLPLYNPLARVVGQQVLNNPDMWKTATWNDKLAREASKILESRMFANAIKDGGARSRVRLWALLHSLAVNNDSSFQQICDLSEELQQEHCAMRKSLLRTRLRGYTNALPEPYLGVDSAAIGPASHYGFATESAGSVYPDLMNDERVTGRADLPLHGSNEGGCAVLQSAQGIIPSQNSVDSDVPYTQSPACWDGLLELGAWNQLSHLHPPLRLPDVDDM